MLFKLLILKVHNCIYLLIFITIITDILLGNVSKHFVSSGTLSMNIDGSCQVLAEEILKIEDIDENVSFDFCKTSKNIELFLGCSSRT